MDAHRRFDLGDAIYDSTVLVDDFTVSTVADPAAQCPKGASSTEVNPPNRFVPINPSRIVDSRGALGLPAALSPLTPLERPLQDAAVLAVAGPQEAPVFVAAEPVDEEDLRQLDGIGGIGGIGGIARNCCTTSTNRSGGSPSPANGLAGVWALAAHQFPVFRRRALWWFTGVAQFTIFVQALHGVIMLNKGYKSHQCHEFYGFVAIIAVAIIYSYRNQLRGKTYLLYGVGSLFVMGLCLRAMYLRR